MTHTNSKSMSRSRSSPS